jgi:tetratricopeptide (TPR) repeat protein
LAGTNIDPSRVDEMSRRKPRPARNIVTSGAGSSADHARHLFASALRQHQAGDLGQAERLYRSVLALEPGHGQSLYHTGIIALQLGRQPQDAIKSIGRVLAFNEPVAEWHYNLAYAHQSVGGLADAVAHYRRAVTLKPDLTAAQANLARALLALATQRRRSPPRYAR